MRQHPFYLLYGIALLALLGVAEWRGWSFFSPSEGRSSPRSVRDNPGAYRPHYINTGTGGSRRYRGGK